jgi:hypothetical protein
MYPFLKLAPWQWGAERMKGCKLVKLGLHFSVIQIRVREGEAKLPSFLTYRLILVM